METAHVTDLYEAAYLIISGCMSSPMVNCRN
jgi:hypothetical protein